MFLFGGWIAQFYTIVVSILCLCCLFRIYMVSSTIAGSETACACFFVDTVFRPRFFLLTPCALMIHLPHPHQGRVTCMGSTKRVSCASALSGFGAPVFTTVVVRCVPIVGVVLSV